jgi:hypothetical protein
VEKRTNDRHEIVSEQWMVEEKVVLDVIEVEVVEVEDESKKKKKKIIDLNLCYMN